MAILEGCISHHSCQENEGMIDFPNVFRNVIESFLNEQTSSPAKEIPLSSVTSVEPDPKRSNCLFVGTTRRDTCLYILFPTDGDLYAWREAIYLRSGLSSDISMPTDFMHPIHVSYDRDTGELKVCRRLINLVTPSRSANSSTRDFLINGKSTPRSYNLSSPKSPCKLRETTVARTAVDPIPPLLAPRTRKLWTSHQPSPPQKPLRPFPTLPPSSHPPQQRRGLDPRNPLHLRSRRRRRRHRALPIYLAYHRLTRSCWVSVRVVVRLGRRR